MSVKMSVNGTQGAILDAASRLFASKGYDAVSMRDVAAEVGVTPANLYHHFKDKEHLVREALTHVFAEKISPMESVLREPKSPEEKFEAFVAWFVHLLTDDEVFSRLLIRELLDGDGDHLEYLAKTVLKRPFALVTNVTTEYGTRAHPVLSSVSVVGVILGHVLLSRVLPHLPGGRAEYADPTVITRHVLGVLRHAFKDESNGKSA